MFVCVCVHNQRAHLDKIVGKGKAMLFLYGMHEGQEQMCSQKQNSSGSRKACRPEMVTVAQNSGRKCLPAW